MDHDSYIEGFLSIHSWVGVLWPRWRFYIRQAHQMPLFTNRHSWKGTDLFCAPQREGVPNRSRAHSTSVLVGASMASTTAQDVNNNKCGFCAATHRSQDFHRYGTMAARRARLESLKLCFLCLSSGYFTRNCLKKMSTAPIATKKSIGFRSTKDRHQVRGILDTASKKSYILKDVAHNLRLEVKN